MRTIVLSALLFAAPAHATSGPWVVGTNQANVYLGGEVQRLTKLHVQGEGGADSQVVDVGEGLSTFGVKAIGTLGLGPRFDVELAVPWGRVIANRPDAPLCADLGLGACRTTESLGVIDVRAKGLLLDELFASPVSLALVGELRIGTFTAGERQRITNLGEGTTDTGLILSLGRSGGLGGGYWAGYLDLGWRYRWPLTDTFPNFEGDRTVPGDEWHGTSEVIFSPDPRWGIGPLLTGLYRPRGLDFLENDLTDRDRFAALRIANLRGGLTLVGRSPDASITGSLSVARVLAAMNNPTDVWIVSAGLSWTGSVKPERGD